MNMHISVFSFSSFSFFLFIIRSLWNEKLRMDSNDVFFVIFFYLYFIFLFSFLFIFYFFMSLVYGLQFEMSLLAIRV